MPNLRHPLCVLALFVLSSVPVVPAGAQSLGTHEDARVDLTQAFFARRDSLIDYFATRIPADDYASGGYMDVAAKLYRGVDLDWCVARLDTLMQDPRGDMFWMYPVTTVMYAGRGKLPPDTWHRMRDLWRTYAPFRGDTENHWAMYYSSLYLMTQLFPDEPGSAWYTGKSSRENFEEAEEYLLSWMDLTTTKGQGEYDSPHYHMVYVAPMAMLYAFADDPAMQQRAGMMLDYLLADYAAEDLDGAYVGAHSRIYEREVIAPWRLPTTGLGWLAFGQGPVTLRGELVPLAFSGYVPPAILYYIATDRSAPYVHREGKRTRHRIRYSDVRNAPVYKYTYMRPEYALGSTQGGLLQPIQQQTWDLTWDVDDDYLDARSTLFSVQPYSSSIELGMYFAELQEFITEIVVRSKTEYDSPDKLTGGSPYEQVFQHEDALIALYDIPKGTRFPHINAFFPGELEDLTEDDSGWIFARGGDKVLIAYYPMAPYEWRPVGDTWIENPGHRRLYSPHLKNGLVLQVAPASAYPSFEAFQDAVRALPLEVATEPAPSVRFTTLGGDVLTATYGETPAVNGTPVDYDAWPLFDGPFLHAEQGSRMLEMRYGPLRRLLDFNTLSVKEWIVTD